MWWKIYFWINLIILSIGLLGFGMYPTWTARDFVDIASCIIAIIGLYAYVYHKSIWTKELWRIYFWIAILILGFDIMYLYSGMLSAVPSYLFSTGIEDVKAWYVPMVLVSLPFYYAIYQLGYSSPKSIKGVNASKPTTKKKKR